MKPAPLPPAGRLRQSACHAGPHPRRGTFLVVAIVVLVITSAIFLALVKVTLQARRAARHEFDRLQAEWLVEAGLERARAALRRDPTYAGEAWEISAASLQRPLGAQVVIAVTRQEPPGPGAPLHGVTVEVVATYPAEGPLAVRRTRKFEIGPRTSSKGTAAEPDAPIPKKPVEDKNRLLPASDEESVREVHFFWVAGSGALREAPENAVS